MLLETQPEGCNIELEPSSPPVAAPPLPRLLDEGAFGTQSCTESLPMCAISCPLPFSIKDTLFFFFHFIFILFVPFSFWKALELIHLCRSKDAPQLCSKHTASFGGLESFSSSQMANCFLLSKHLGGSRGEQVAVRACRALG